MSDLTTYRQMTEAEDEAHRYPACPHVEDHRLRDIADAWNEYVEAEKESINATGELTLGPNAVKLLDALTKEDNDE